MIHIHENGITVVAKNEAKRGKVYELNGENYYVARGLADIRKIIDSKEFPLNRVVTSKLTSLNGLFQIQGGYRQLAVPDNFDDDISNWDTSNVLSMEEVFTGWPKFNQDISNWDTSKVESMHGMFKSSKYQGSYYMGPTSFNQDISKWDVSNVKNMSEIFLGATSFNQDISKWDVSNVVNMNYMFSGATSFNQNISKWDLGNVESMRGMFSDVVSIGIVAFVGTLEYNRAGSTSFNQDISNWDLSNVNDMNGMFSGATSFNQDISKWDVSNVNDISNMFSGATAFNQPLGNWNVSKIESMREMFRAATSFNQDISKWDVSNVENMYHMFSGAKSFNKNISKWDVSNVESMRGMFSSATSFNQDLNGWDVSSLYGVENMFYGATSFNAPIGKWNVKSITNMENMFREAISFNQDISGWDVSNVTQMKGLFQDATSFNQDLTNWKLNEKLPKSRTMFEGAEAFNIKEYNPFLNKKAKKREVDTSTAKLSSEDKKTISKIKKFLVSRDLDKIDLGLELLISLNNDQLYESLLHECKIDSSNNNLVSNKVFTGSGPAQPFLNYALINIIANAPEHVNKDESLQLKNITTIDTSKLNLKYDYSKFPKFIPLKKFTHLNLLKLNFNDFDFSKINISEAFVNHNIKKLEVKEAEGSLKWLSFFTKVENLSFQISNYSRQEISDFSFFEYLENLEFLDFYPKNLEDLNFLSNCKKLKELQLSIVDSYGDKFKLKNLDFLENLINLEKLTISGLGNEINIDGLIKCENIKYLSLSLTAGEGFNIKSLKGCKSLEYLKLDGISNVDLEGDILELGKIKVKSNLSKFSSDSKIFTILNDNNKIKEKSQEIIRVKENQLEDVGVVTHFKGSPFTGILEGRGTTFGVHNIFYSYEMLNGYKNGSKIEYYTSGEREGKAQVEQYYENDKYSKIVGIFNDRDENIIKDQLCVHSSHIEYKNDLFYYDNKPYTGSCYLKFETTGVIDGKYDEWATLKKNTIQDLLAKYSAWEITSYKDPRTLLFMLNLKNGTVINNFSVLNTKSCFEKLIIAEEIDIKSEPVYNWIVKKNLSSEGKSLKLNGKSLVITGVFENHSREELKNMIISNGGKPSSSVSANTHLIIAGSKVGPNKMLKAKELNIDIINENEFIEMYNSNSDDSHSSDEKYFMEIISDENVKLKNNNNSKNKLSSDVKKSFNEVKKLIFMRDLNKIDEGINLLISLNETEIFETLLDGCRLSYEDGRWGAVTRLETNKLFTGSGPAQPFLNYALFCVIANCPQDSKIDSSFFHINLTKMNINDFLPNYSLGGHDIFPPILKFSHLDSLIIDFKIFEEMNKGSDNKVDRKDWFKGNNIKSLDIPSCSGSLKWLKNFSELKKLNYKYGYYETLDYESFKYLTDLEELKLVDIKNTKNLDFIKNSKNLKKLTLEFSSYGNEIEFEDLNILKNFTNLQELVIKNISTNVNISSISNCLNIKKLIIKFQSNWSDDKKLEDCIDSNLFENCKNLEFFDVTGIKQISLKANIIDLNGLNGLNKLKKLKIDNFIINGIDDKVFIN